MAVDTFKLSIANRAFKYGDGFFETMHVNGLKVQFIDTHFQRINKAAEVLKMEFPEFFSKEFLEKQIAGLLTRMKLFQGVRLRVSFIRSGEGLYKPHSNTCDLYIEANYLSTGLYELNDKGLTIGIYSENNFHKSFYSSFKTLNALPYILAANYAKQNGFDDVLLINAENNITEATSSNFFAVKKNTLYTPDLKLGCVAGVMRKQIIRIAKDVGYEVQETLIKISDLEGMDEMFLTNTIAGIKYVSGFNKKRYYKRVARKLLRELNNQAFN